MSLERRGLQNTLVLIMQSGVTHSLISSHWAINYTKAAATNFCGAVRDDRWSVHAATSASFHLSSWLLLLSLMMYNSLQLHLTCTSDGCSGCLPGVMKKKVANKHRIGSVYINLPHVSLISPRWCINTSLDCFPVYTTVSNKSKSVCDRVVMTYTRENLKVHTLWFYQWTYTLENYQYALPARLTGYKPLKTRYNTIEGTILTGFWHTSKPK